MPKVTPKICIGTATFTVFGVWPKIMESIFLKIGLKTYQNIKKQWKITFLSKKIEEQFNSIYMRLKKKPYTLGPKGLRAKGPKGLRFAF